MSDRTGVLNMYSEAADGTGIADRVSAGTAPEWPTSINSDGTRVIGFTVTPATKSDVVLFSVPGGQDQPRTASAQRPRPSRAESLLAERFEESFGELSPNNQYLAYESSESGRPEIHVRPYPDVDSRGWQISTGGGTRAAWGPTGRELFYIDGSGTLTSVAVDTWGPTLVVGKSATVFRHEVPPTEPRAPL